MQGDRLSVQKGETRGEGSGRSKMTEVEEDRRKASWIHCLTFFQVCQDPLRVNVSVRQFVLTETTFSSVASSILPISLVKAWKVLVFMARVPRIRRC